MGEFASSQETQRALGYLLKLQEDPETLEGFFNKYPDANPFTSWPFLKGPTEAFLRYFETTGIMPEQEAGAAVLLPNSVDELKLRELVEEFDREFAAAKEGRVNASTASKKFVSALIENAKKSNVTIPEASSAGVVGVAGPHPIPPVPQAPVPQGAEGAPVSPERIREIAVAAIGRPGPPEEKMFFFQALTSFASEQPARSVTELTPRAAEVTEAARVLCAPVSTFPGAQSFSALATNNFQKGVASVLDVVVPPAAKESIINKILLQPLDTIVNHPEALPQPIMETMTDRWGTNFVNSSWFTALRADSNRMMGDQKSALKVTTRFTALVSDIATTVFRGPLDKKVFAPGKTVSGLTYNVVTYIETYRLVSTQGIPMVSVSHYGNIALGYGSQILRMGADYVMRRAVKAGVKAAVKKAAVSTAAKVGVEAVAGVSTGGMATLVMIGADLVRGLIKKGAAVLKSFLFMGTSKNPEDNLILVVTAGVVLVFFLPIFPLLNIPAFNQSMIDTSIATNMEGIGGGGAYENGLNCLDPVNKDNPDCELTQCQGDCAWPLETSTHACIVEGPLVGTHSGCRLSAIDFAGPGLFGAPVHTPYSGVVTSAVFGYPDNSGYLGSRDGGTYGNHVIVKADNGAVLVFAHLRNIQMVQEGPITKNTVVGFVDNTGYSGGTHLHYEDMGGGGCPRTGADINKYLPYPVPPCLGGADCAAQMSAQGHSSCL